MAVPPAPSTPLESAPLSPTARAYFEQIFKPGLMTVQAETPTSHGGSRFSGASNGSGTPYVHF